MADDGVKSGYASGATDDFRFKAIEDKVHVRDLQATTLKLPGFNQQAFTCRCIGRDFRLTGVQGLGNQRTRHIGSINDVPISRWNGL